MMKIICTLALFLFFNRASAFIQEDAGLSQYVVSTSDSMEVRPLAKALAKILPDKMIYLKGEFHNVKSTSISDRSIFMELHEQKGVNYYLAEYSHSYFYGCNLFLKTGDLKILADWGNKLGLDSMSLKNYYHNLTDLYQYNLTQLPSKRISFIGIDIDLQNSWTRTNVQDDYIKALKYLRQYAYKPLPGEINHVFDKILAAKDYIVLNDLNFRLQELSKMYTNELMACFGEFYKDYYLIINSVKRFPGVYREKELLTNFKLAVQGILTVDPQQKPRFFGSFGSFHASVELKDSFASILKASKKFQDSLALIASGYYNSVSYFDNLRPVLLQGASISGLNKKEQINANKVVEVVSRATNKQLILMSDFQKLPKGKYDFFKHYDAFLIYQDFK